MKFIDQWIARFNKLALREQLLVVVAMAAVLYFAVDFALLGPQQKRTVRLLTQDQANKIELASISKTLAELGTPTAKQSDPLARDRALLEDLKKQIAEADAFLGQANATTPQVGALVREMLGASPGLTLVSLKTLPVTTFYTPRNAPAGNDKPAANGAAPQTPIYRHGVEVSVKGNYLALLPYLENLQKYPKRLFWSEAKLDASAYPDAVLKVVIYTLSEQPSSPLG
jgi:MSHA biogenesis protein MshJ